jgi:hypothetical protein
VEAVKGQLEFGLTWAGDVQARSQSVSRDDVDHSQPLEVRHDACRIRRNKELDVSHVREVNLGCCEFEIVENPRLQILSLSGFRKRNEKKGNSLAVTVEAAVLRSGPRRLI